MQCVSVPGRMHAIEPVGVLTSKAEWIADVSVRRNCYEPVYSPALGNRPAALGQSGTHTAHAPPSAVALTNPSLTWPCSDPYITATAAAA